MLIGVIVLTVYPLPAGAAETPVQTFTIVRTTTGPASFKLVIDGEPSEMHPHGFWGGFAGRVQGGRVAWAAGLGDETFEYDAGVTARAAGHRVDVCGPLGGCIVDRVLAYQIFVGSDDKGESDAMNRVWIVHEGPAKIHFTGHGWKLVRTPLRYRYQTQTDADGNGVYTGVYSFNAMPSARLPGGRFGSLAAGTPPCSTSSTFVGVGVVHRGVGSATLTGENSQTITCPTSQQTLLTGFARKAVTWRFSGTVAGDSTSSAVPLFVLDLPRRV